MKLFGKVVIIRIEATNKKNLDAKLKSLREMFNVSNEFNWGKSYIIKVEDIYEKE